MLFLIGPHRGVRDFSLIRQWLSQMRFPFSCHSQNWKCALFITSKKSPPKTTSFKFIVTDLPLLPHVYFLKWFQTNFPLTAPPWVSMATTAWESTAACLRAAHRPSLADVTHCYLCFRVGHAGRHGQVLTLTEVYIMQRDSPGSLWCGDKHVVEDLIGLMHCNAFLERIFKTSQWWVCTQ